MEDEKQPKTVKTIKDPHLYLFNIVSSCLLKEIRYYDSSEQRRDIILSSLSQMANLDPEFILQLAYYLRNELYIRTTTNFLLAFAACHPKTQPFLVKYFQKTVLLPTDLIEVVQYFQIVHFLKNKDFVGDLSQILNENFRKKLYISKSLKKASSLKFNQFSLYQLGKYCSEPKRKSMLKKYKSALTKIAPKKKIKKKEEEQKNENKNPKIVKKIGKYKKTRVAKPIPNTIDVSFISMKDLIRLAHIKAPVTTVLSLLGKRYPKTIEEFSSNLSFKDMQFDPTLSGKRLKVPVPKTWETELSAKGNKPEVWESLVFDNKLPYMAMMRNLRNLLKSGITDAAHQKIIEKISNFELVSNSKMFPFQYFSALEAINDTSYLEENNIQIDQQLKEKYKTSIEKAIGLAVDKNVETISGHTVIFSDVSGSMDTKISGSGKKSYGSIRTCKEIGLLLGLLIRAKCEKCSFFIFSSPNHSQCYLPVELKGKDLLENMNILKQEATKLGGGTDFPYECILDLTNKNIHVDNIVILSDMMISEGFEDISKGKNLSVTKVLNDYRNKVNDKLKIFSFNLAGYGKDISLADEFNEESYIRIYGMSDSVLKFMAVKEGNTQIEHIRKFAQNI